MNFLLTLHGEIRWLVAIVGVIALIKFVIGWLRREEYKPIDRGLMSGFAGVMDINVLLGLILLFSLGLAGNRIEHATTMILAAVAAHSSMLWRKSPDAVKKFRNNFFAVLIALLLVFIGVMRLRGGWVF